MAPRSRLPRVSPVSAFGFFICCVGIIWTYVQFFQFKAGILMIKPGAVVPGSAAFAPFLEYDTVKRTLNGIIQENNLNVPPLTGSGIIAFAAWYSMFNCYNAIADELDRKQP